MPNEELVRGAATVVNLASHFAQLKLRAGELIQSITASHRGFFTPTEDEQTRHLLVSYWHSRNALFELVSSFHHVERFGPEDRPLALAISYAGALALVDVARFLRENFHERPVVRQKLNEPEPHFGIPSGTYDLVQKSLTSPVHAWHLYHAFRFVELNRDALQKTAAQHPDFAAVLKIIPQLQHRLDIAPESYVAARARVRGSSIRTRIGRDLLGRALYGLQKCISRLISDYYVVSNHKPGLPAAIEQELQAQLQPGDIIIVRKEHAVTNYFLPGYWPHAALYLGSIAELRNLGLDQHDNVLPRWQQLESCDLHRPHRVLEAMKDGVRIRSVACPFGSDALCIVRPQLAVQDIAAAIGRGMFHEGKSYDFDFDFSRSDRIVCTEVVYRSYEGISGIEFQLTRRAGRLTLSAEDILQKAIQQDRFRIHAVYCPGRSGVVSYAADAEDAIRQTKGRKKPFG